MCIKINKKRLETLADKEAEKINVDFHKYYRTRWTINQMVKRGLLRFAKILQREHKKEIKKLKKQLEAVKK